MKIFEKQGNNFEVQLSLTRAHAKGLGQIIAHSEAALLPI